MAYGGGVKRNRTADPVRTKVGTGRRQGRGAAPELVSPRWLLRAFLLAVGVAGVCGYLTFCWLFVQGQWQLVLHPSRPGEVLPLHLGGAVPETVRFAVDSSGQPQLTGVLLAADPAGRFRHLTVLYLLGGDGSLADASARLAEVQRLGLSVFSFDYRGFGRSAGGHPSQRTMEADSDQALRYLLQERRVAPGRLLLYGEGVGGYLAARLAAAHPEIPAMIVDTPRLNLVETVRHDPRVRLLPVRLLFRETFPVESLLRSLPTPKLLVWRGGEEPGVWRDAADPKMTVALPVDNSTELPRLLARFLDQYAPPTPPPALVTPQRP